MADGPTSANDGAILAGLTADVEFDVADKRGVNFTNE